MKKNLLAGLLVGGLLVYLSVKGVRWQDVAAGFQGAKKESILLSLVFMFFMQVLRSIRWGAILRPLGQVPPMSLFAVTSVGFMAIVALPARIGELVRPCLIAGKSSIKMSSAMGTILVERACDSLTLMIILGTILFFMPFPPWLLKAGGLFLLVTLGVFFFMIFLIFKREVVLHPLLKRLPTGVSHRLDHLIHSFIEGLVIITDVRSMLYVLLLSALIWLADAGAIYVLFYAFGFPLGPVAAFALMIVLVIGIAIPTAPGFIGNWHFFCILGLGLFGIPRPDALTFAIVYHFLSIGIVLILGLIFLPSNRFSLADISGKGKQTE